MNAKSLAAAIAIALVGSSAMAFEATEFVDPAPAAAAPAPVAPSAVVVSRGEATQFADVQAATRDRVEVRAEAREAAQAHAFNALYVGS